MSTPQLSGLVRNMREMRFATVPVALMAIMAAGIYTFLAIADEVSENELAQIDSAILLMLRDPADVSVPIGPAWFEQAVIEITTLGGYPVLVTLVTAVAGFLLVARQYGPAVFMLGSIITGTLASHFLKIVYDRPRPDVVDHLVEIHTASFPSGHATMSAVVYLTLATMIVRLVDDVAVRIYVLSAAVVLTMAVGMSRVYLGVHWPSDVLAGWALGATWACLSWLTVSGLKAVLARR